jgi:hypothetical protein
LTRAEIAIARGRTTEAVDLLSEAKGLADLWLVRFTLGRAFEEANRHAEALSELELCQKRRGESTAVYLDDVPSYRYLGRSPYRLARRGPARKTRPGSTTRPTSGLKALRRLAAADAASASENTAVSSLPGLRPQQPDTAQPISQIQIPGLTCRSAPR